MMILRQSIVLIVSFFSLCQAFAVDATGEIERQKKFGDWIVAEFIGSKQILYRLANVADRNQDWTLVFDFFTSKMCTPDPATIILNVKRYEPMYADGRLMFEYKLPGNVQSSVELVRTAMAKGDNFAFFSFGNLSAERLFRANEYGKLALWVSEGHEVKRSPNIYFSLDGFRAGLDYAVKRCSANR